MAKEGKEAYWVLYSYSEIEGNKKRSTHYWKKILTEDAMWKFVASFSRSSGVVWHVIKGKRIKVN